MELAQGPAADRNYYYGPGGIARVPVPSRKRNASVAFPSDVFNDLADSFNKNLKLSPDTLHSIEVVDRLIKDEDFVKLLMKNFPEAVVRKLAITCKRWHHLAYKSIREKRRNRPFLNLWSTELKSWESNPNLDLNSYFHPNLICGGGKDRGRSSQSQRVANTKRVEKGLADLAILVNDDMIMDNESLEPVPGTSKGCTSLAKTPNRRNGLETVDTAPKPIEVIINYANSAMDTFLCELGKTGIEENTTCMYPSDSAGLYILSSSVCLTTPDNREVVYFNPSTSSETMRMLSSLMFPKSSHLLMEVFVVPAVTEESPCISRVIGDQNQSKTPKALVLYQYLNLMDSEPGIVGVLEALKTIAGSTGFPMVTGQYDVIDGGLGPDSEQPHGDAVAGGILFSGDENCQIGVFSVDFVAGDQSLDSLQKMQNFFRERNFPCKVALAFYHNFITSNEKAKDPNVKVECEWEEDEVDGSMAETENQLKEPESPLEEMENIMGNEQSSYDHLKNYLQNFHECLPGVQLFGIGSSSGAHAMFVNRDTANANFNALNRHMMDVSGAGSSHEKHENVSAAHNQMAFVLLAYDSD